MSTLIDITLKFGQSINMSLRFIATEASAASVGGYIASRKRLESCFVFSVFFFVVTPSLHAGKKLPADGFKQNAGLTMAGQNNLSKFYRRNRLTTFRGKWFATRKIHGWLEFSNQRFLSCKICLSKFLWFWKCLSVKLYNM